MSDEKMREVRSDEGKSKEMMKDYGSYFQSYPHFEKEVDIVVGIPHKYPMSQEAKDTDRFVKLQ
ncbi:unnamed protein product [Brugia timori]|uniref:Agmatinase n=1 Tax=Brugia timori TaxID=42155 RepID=A0A0R3QLP3_9BILA|nr:unnamed protein product [Brugia timori]